MNKITELFVTTAYAQVGERTNATQSSFTIKDFFFLNPFKPAAGTSGQEAFSQLLGRIIGIALTLAAVGAFFYLLFSGFQYITAGGDAAKATAARTGIVNALIGIVVILVDYVILKYVGTALVPTRE